MKRIDLKKLILVLLFLFLFSVVVSKKETKLVKNLPEQNLSRDESILVDIAEKSSPSVVTVAIKTPQRRVVQFNPFGGGYESRIEGEKQQDIGTGFVVGSDGLIITNKHVVSSLDASYKVITKDDKEYEVIQISRDPANDLAILKIDPSASSGLAPLELGDSANLKVGQFAMAIGTALGEFRHTVTTGVVSGLGRGIVAGSFYEGNAEKLDDVIQTDAAINPGNSGGPLLNSSGQVIGVNVAVAQGAQNIGFAIPINTVKKSIEEFQKTGKFTSKPFLGILYRKLPQGAFIEEVINNSPAQRAEIKSGDIITKINDQSLSGEEVEFAKVIEKYEAGDNLTLTILRNDKTLTVDVILSSQ